MAWDQFYEKGSLIWHQRQGLKGWWWWKPPLLRYFQWISSTTGLYCPATSNDSRCIFINCLFLLRIKALFEWRTPLRGNGTPWEGEGELGKRAAACKLWVELVNFQFLENLWHWILPAYSVRTHFDINSGEETDRHWRDRRNIWHNHL